MKVKIRTKPVRPLTRREKRSLRPENRPPHQRVVIPDGIVTSPQLTANQILRLLPKAQSDAMMLAVTKSIKTRKIESVDNEKFIPYPPNPGPQTIFFNAIDKKEILYGGAAGGGKTDALLMAALRYVHVPGYAAIIFRRTFPMLNTPDGLIHRSKAWLMGTSASWSESKHQWTFPSGATLTFAHMQYDNDVYNHQGAAYQFIGFDELTQFTRFQYTYLFSRCRRPKVQPTMPAELKRRLEGLANVPLIRRAASNPGGVGHFWVKKRFITEPGKRIYIPATLDDNPALDRDTYLEMLNELDPILRAQLLKGDWDATEDGLLSWQTISSCQRDGVRWPLGATAFPVGIRRPELYIGVDIGRTTHNTVIWVWEKCGDGIVRCRDMKVLRNVTFADQKEAIHARMSPHVVRCHIDKGGIGYQLAEEMEGAYPAQCEGVQLSRGKAGQIAQLMYAYFTRGIVEIPKGNEDLDEDLQLVRRTDTVGGIPIVETDEGPSGHADRFWAAGLGLYGIPNLIPKRSKSIPHGVHSGHLRKHK